MKSLYVWEIIIREILIKIVIEYDLYYLYIYIINKLCCT